MKHAHLPLIAVVIAAAALMAACFDDGTNRGTNQACVPGQSIACTCPSGAPGAQACLPSGAGYDACVCAAASDTFVGDTTEADVVATDTTDPTECAEPGCMTSCEVDHCASPGPIIGEGEGGQACEEGLPDPFLPYPAGVHMGVTQGPGCGGHSAKLSEGYDFNVAGGSYESSHELLAVAATPGTVLDIVWEVTGGCSGCNGSTYNYGWGNCVLVQIDGYCVIERYCHLKPGGVIVAKGDKVCSGQPLGYIGSTGNSTGDHLHYQRERTNGQSIPIARFQEAVVPSGCNPCATSDHMTGCYASLNAEPTGDTCKVIEGGHSGGVPTGFDIVHAATGVSVYRKDYSGGTPDWVTVVDLRSATVKQLTGTVSGAPNGVVDRLSLAQHWANAVQAAGATTHAEVVVNGAFFSTADDPTGIAFGLEVDGAVVSLGYGLSEFPGKNKMLAWNNAAASARIAQYDTGTFYDGPPQVLGGLAPDAPKSPDSWLPRTFVGIRDADQDGTPETMLIFSSTSAKQQWAADVLASFGATGVIMLDGGGSTGLYVDGSAWIATSRTLPHTLAVYSGKDAVSVACPGDCSGHGSCDDASGTCSCYSGFAGSSCSQCASGYSGYPSCYAPQSCPSGCSGHGSCDDASGTCSCYSGYAGSSCSQCASGYSGYPSCYTPQSCPSGCSGHGSCDDASGTCSCYSGYAGSSCSQCASGYSGYPSCYTPQSCPSGCSGHGSCDDASGTCSCYSGFTGSACSQCASGYSGYPSCYAPQSCPSGCSGHGSCSDASGTCSCYSGYAGSSCSQCASGYSGYPSCYAPQSCPSGCSGHGSCNDASGTCSCYSGFTGSACSQCASGYSGYPGCTQGFCGNGVCEAAESPGGCSSDCGASHLSASPSIYWGNTLDAANLSCTSTSGSWWHYGTSGGLPYWVFASNCGVPSASNPTSYSGYNARWTFTIKKAGNYLVDAWVPTTAAACGFPSIKLSTQNHYILHGPGTAKRADVSQRDHVGAAMTLWGSTYLNPGSYTVYLYDDAGGGCACNDTSSCTGPVSTRVFADGLGVTFLP